MQHFLSFPQSHTRNASVAIFHILVGEGVPREQWRLALIGAIRAGIRELWVMEHDRIAFPDSIKRNATTQMFTLGELRDEVVTLATAHCGRPPRLLSACPILAPTLRRNLLVGVTCACSDDGTIAATSPQRAESPHTTEGMACDDGLFCCAERGSGQTTLYRGPQFVYPFHADAVLPMAQLGTTGAALLTRHGLATSESSTEQQGHASARNTVFASVAGSLGVFNVLVNLPPMRRVVLYDVNTWTLEYAAMVVEVIRVSRSRADFLTNMFGRDASAVANSSSTAAFARDFLNQPFDPSLVTATTSRLSARAACTHRWLTTTLMSHTGARRPPSATRSVCERVLLTSNPKANPKTSPATVAGCSDGYGKRFSKTQCLSAAAIHPNSCTPYYGHGWLRNETSFNSLRDHLARVSYVEWNATQPLDNLVGGSEDTRAHRGKASLVLYTSNIANWVGEANWRQLLVEWAQHPKFRVYLAESLPPLLSSSAAPKGRDLKSCRSWPCPSIRELGPYPQPATAPVGN